MKNLALIIFITFIINFTASAQLNKIYGGRTWDIYAQYNSYSSNETSNLSTFKFNTINPIFLRAKRDKTGRGKSHILFNPRFLNDLLWSIIFKKNDSNALENHNTSNGLIGQLNWTINIISSNKFVFAIGAEMGDYTSGGETSYGIGPSVLTDFAITNKIAIGMHMWAAKTDTNDGAFAHEWFYGFFPRVLFKSGIFIEPGLMFTDGESNSRFEINIGKKMRG